MEKSGGSFMLTMEEYMENTEYILIAPDGTTVNCPSTKDFITLSKNILQNYYELGECPYGNPIDDAFELMTPEQIAKWMALMSFTVKIREKDGGKQ